MIYQTIFYLFINSSYNNFLRKNPAKIISNMTNDVGAVCSGYLIK